MHGIMNAEEWVYILRNRMFAYPKKQKLFHLHLILMSSKQWFRSKLEMCPYDMDAPA